MSTETRQKQYRLCRPGRRQSKEFTMTSGSLALWNMIWILQSGDLRVGTAGKLLLQTAQKWANR
jgi:hypothetical protein